MISNPSVPNSPGAAPETHSSPALVGLAWLVVVIPLAWGVYNTVKTSTNLFTSAAPAVTQTGATH